MPFHFGNPDAPPAPKGFATYGPTVQLSQDVPYQSFFDTTLLQNALAAQPPNQPIVPSTLLKETLPGYAVGVHPASECPAAIDFKVAGTPVLICKPGQIIRPIGLQPGKGSFFQGFNWGLPFGWLGGGLIQLVVFQAPDSYAFWPGNPELIFHRSRFPIAQPSDLNNTSSGLAFNNAPNNWPRRFPWNNATRKISGNANSFAQQGKPLMSISDCDRVLLVLRDPNSTGKLPLTAQASLRVIYQASTDLDMTGTGTIPLTNTPSFEDIQLTPYASVGSSGNLATQNPAYMINPSSPGGSTLLRMNCDSGGIVFVDTSGVAALNGLFIDVVRYGRL